MVRVKAARARGPIFAGLSLLLLVLSSNQALAQSIPATVEDVADRSDLIALGRVTATDPEGVLRGSPWQMVYTRHTFEIETYYKGTGPKSISLYTPGGIRTRIINGEPRRIVSQGSAGEGAEIGEEFLAFLRAAGDGYVFIEWDGAKYSVKTDPETDERYVTLRLRKKKYMQGKALENFKGLEARETIHDAAARIESRLTGTRGIGETVPLGQLRAKILIILRGEQAPAPRGVGATPSDNP